MISGGKGDLSQRSRSPVSLALTFQLPRKTVRLISRDISIDINRGIESAAKFLPRFCDFVSFLF